MKLLICDDKKTDVFYFPNEIKEYYSISYYYTRESNCETLALYEKDGKWAIDANVNMQVFIENKKYQTVFLKQYSAYRIYFADLNKYVNMYIIPDLEEYIEVNLNGMNRITIGSTNNNGYNIVYNLPLYTNLKVSIENINGTFVVKNLNPKENCIYVNKRAIVSCSLNLGDVIFMNGLKIIWMGNYFKLNKLDGKIELFGLNQVNIQKTKTTVYTPASETERNSILFNENQTFFHTPRIQSKIKREKISIDSPPDGNNEEKMPVALTLGSTIAIGLSSCFTIVTSIQNFGSQSKFTSITQLLMGVLMLVSSLLIPILTETWEKNHTKKLEKNRCERYNKYLDEKVELINKTIKMQEAILHESNLTLKEIQKRIQNNSEMLWYREIVDEDFLNVRLGLGNLPAEIDFEIPDDHFSLSDDELKIRLNQIRSQKNETTNVPICISMSTNRVTPFIINVNYKQDYINSIMLQLMFYYSPIDLKIVVLTNELNEHKWEYIRYLPHCWSKDGDKRFFATSDDEMSQLSIFLEQIYNRRLGDSGKKGEKEYKKDEFYKKYSEYYLIITDDFKVVKNLFIIKKILDSDINLGFSLLIFENSLKNLPSRLDKFIDIEENFSAIYSKENDYQIKFAPEISKGINIQGYAKILSNIPVLMKSGGESQLPNSLTFLEMYNAARIDHLNILQNWHNNDPTISLNAQLGVKKDKRALGLDLHEKYHGPHGLIAGTTGSGKSEFIITYVLSMAVTYSPYEVQFVLIDYKGGGLAGAFENRDKGIKIPHLVGTITNLDTSEMNRTLVSIKSEMQRRQIKFNEARDVLGEGTIDIYKYQKLYREGKVKDPIAHLFIICDEFAELKQQQPDFMEELISTSRIGRSLGVHLILATQKPSGVVDEQIWSNSKFKVCLKVQTINDSNEMLKKSDAAYIKESGRFYLQVGNDEIYELGQSGWAGAKYVPSDRIINKIDDSINFISNDGNILKSINDEVKQLDNVDYGEQLTNIVKYLYDLAIRENYKFNSLWLPSMSSEIFIPDLIKKYNYERKINEFNAIIGEYDKPAKQLQGLYTLNLNSKNTVIFGMPNSGKENYIYNVIYSLSIYHNPEEINFYILDFGSEALRIFGKLPTVGDFITANEPEKIGMQFEYLEKEMRKRKELFVDYSGSFEEYCSKSGKKVPLIVTILNAYESFMENCMEYDGYLSRLLREGSKYGIIFITSAVSTNSIRSTVQEYYNNKIILQVNDDFEYRFLLGAPMGLVPKKIFGRGLTKIDGEVCEFQTAYISIKDNINTIIKGTGKKLYEYFDTKAPEIKALPNVIKIDKMFKYAKSVNKIPLGYTRDDVELLYYDFTKNNTNLIIGKEVTKKIDFMCSIIDLIDSIQDIKFNIFDFISCIDTDGNAFYYNFKFEQPFNEIINYKDNKYVINVFIGLGNIIDVLDNNEKILFDNIMNNINQIQNQTFIIFDDIDRLKKIENYPWYYNINKASGIWVGTDIDEQSIFSVSNLTTYDIEEEMKQLIYVITNNNYVVAKGIGGEEDNLFE